MRRCNDNPDMTDEFMKTALNPNQSMNHIPYTENMQQTALKTSRHKYGNTL